VGIAHQFIFEEHMWNSVKWVFLDLGETLVDETEAHRHRLRATQDHLQQNGHRYSVDELIRMCEEAATEFAPSPFLGMLSRIGLSEDQIASISASARFEKEKEALYAGVPQLLETLSRRFSLGVIANQPEGTEKRLKRWGIRERFSLVFASAELGISKPDPRIFEAALSEAGCRPTECVIVGDRLDNDIGPAKRQGWRALRVLQGFCRFQVSRSPLEVPDLTVPNIQALSTATCPHLSEL